MACYKTPQYLVLHSDMRQQLRDLFEALLPAFLLTRTGFCLHPGNYMLEHMACSVQAQLVMTLQSSLQHLSTHLEQGDLPYCISGS